MDLIARQHVRATKRALPGGGVLRDEGRACSPTNPGAERTNQISMRALGSTRGSRREATLLLDLKRLMMADIKQNQRSMERDARAAPCTLQPRRISASVIKLDHI